jgi:hypothetical protein
MHQMRKSHINRFLPVRWRNIVPSLPRSHKAFQVFDLESDTAQQDTSRFIERYMRVHSTVFKGAKEKSQKS